MGDIADIPQQKMNVVDNLRAECTGLWSFSLAFYGRPDVPDALVALQDEAGLNVNLILFAAWLGLSGRGRLDTQRIDQAKHAVHSIQFELIEPLRALRRRLKTVLDPDIQSLRERIKVVEIDAERVSQSRLAGIAGPISTTDPAECVADAEANLLFYLGAEHQAATQAAIIRRELQLWLRTVGRFSRFRRSHPSA